MIRSPQNPFFLFTIFIVCLNTTAWTSTCASAFQLECGENYWFDSPKDDHFNRIHYDLDGCLNSTMIYDGGDELFYVDVNGYSKDLTIRLHAPGANYDLFVFESCVDHYNAVTFESCVTNSLNGQGMEDTVVVKNAYGRYYIVVDAPDPSQTGDYFLYINCSEDPAFVCESIPELHCGKNQYGYNTSYSHHATKVIDHHPTCNDNYADYGGYESVYKIVAHHGDLYDLTVDLRATGYHQDLDLFIYRECWTYQDPYTGKVQYEFGGLINPCHYTYAPHSEVESAFIEHLDAYDELYVVVEGRANYHGYDEGSFELVLSCGGPCRYKDNLIDCNAHIFDSTWDEHNKASYYECDPYENRGNNWGPEKSYAFDLESKTDIKIELWPEDIADLNLYLLERCDQATCIEWSKTIGHGKKEIIETTLWPGNYRLVVEGYQGDRGDFELKMSGCRCTDVEEIWCDQEVSGSTVGGSQFIDEIKDECFALASWPVNIKGRERIYSFRSPESKEYTFELNDLTGDVNLYLIEDCSDINSCRGFSTKAGSSPESITEYLHAGEEIFVLVDSWSELLTSDYTLTVSCIDSHEIEPDETVEDDEVEDMEHLCLDITVDQLQIVHLDLSTITDTTCAESIELKVYRIDPLTEQIDSVSELSLYEGLDQLQFKPSAASLATTYRFVFRQACSGEIFTCSTEVTIAPILECGMTYLGSTIDRESQFFKEEIEACYSSPSLFDGPDQLVQIEKHSEEEILEIVLFQDDANLSLFIFDDSLEAVRGPCKGANFMGTKSIGNTASVGEYWSDADDPLPPGTYFALIEGFAKAIESDFALSVSCRQSCTSTAVMCGQALEVENNFSQTNTRARYSFGGEDFVGYTGGETTYSFSLSEATDVSVILSNIQVAFEGGDIDLFLARGGCVGYEIIGQSVEEGGEEQIDLTLDSGDYVIFVDGWQGSEASYDLTLLGCDLGALVESPLTKSKLLEGQKTLMSYPNPFKDNVYFELPDDASEILSVRIHTLDGRVVFQKTGKQLGYKKAFIVSAHDLGMETGVLIYQLVTADSVHSGRIIRI